MKVVSFENSKLAESINVLQKWQEFLKPFLNYKSFRKIDDVISPYRKLTSKYTCKPQSEFDYYFSDYRIHLFYNVIDKTKVITERYLELSNGEKIESHYYKSHKYKAEINNAGIGTPQALFDAITAELEHLRESKGYIPTLNLHYIYQNFNSNDEVLDSNVELIKKNAIQELYAQIAKIEKWDGISRLYY